MKIKKILTSIRWFTLFLIVFISINSCQKESSDTLTGPAIEGSIVHLDKLEQGKVYKLNDYPLFVMSYRGDYGFSRFLKTGIREIVGEKINNPDWGCTCFTGMVNNKIFGRNFDYYHHIALALYTHPRNAFASLSIVDLYYLGFNESSSANQIENSNSVSNAPFWPMDGINEKGVAIGQMALPYADPPYDPSKRSLNCLEIIRLVLDYASNTDEAVSLIQQYNYNVNGGPPVHFMIADKSGKSAIIEFINKEMKVIYNNEPYHVSTNFIITGSLAPQTTDCWRYNKAYSDLKNAGGSIDETAAMNILQSVSQSITMWSAVYNLNTPSLNISTGKDYSKDYKLLFSNTLYSSIVETTWQVVSTFKPIYKVRVIKIF